MKNIGIMTHSVATNYGANLQALSTANYLKKRGFNPVFFRWSEYLSEEQQDRQAAIHQKFLDNQGYIVSKQCKNDKDFLDTINEYNIRNIIVGSDCILTYHNKRHFPYILTRRGFVRIKGGGDYQFPNPFWLPFIKEDDEINLFMVSGSCGSSDIPNDKTIRDRMKVLLNRFLYLSVRDSYTKRMVKTILGSDNRINLTPDPVFGFNANRLPGTIFSKEDLIEKYHLPERYYVISFYYSYWPSQKWADELMAVAHSNGIKCVSIPMPLGKRKSNFDVDIDGALDPLEWYDIIRYSEGYIGNNMHPMIVAMHNSVPFFDFNIHGKYILQGKIQTVSTSKEVDLLKRFNLEKYQIPQQRSFLVSPSQIVEKLLSFNRIYCSKCASQLQENYLKMMDTISGMIQQD